MLANLNISKENATVDEQESKHLSLRSRNRKSGLTYEKFFANGNMSGIVLFLDQDFEGEYQCRLHPCRTVDYKRMPIFIRARDSLMSFSNRSRQAHVHVDKYLKLKSEKMQRIELQTLEKQVWNFSLAYLDTQNTIFLTGGDLAPKGD